MYILDGKRININSHIVVGDFQYPNLLDEDLRIRLGVEEIQPPAPPSDYAENPDYYFVTEQDYAPYIVYTKKSDEQVDEIKLNKAKSSRLSKVGDIVVTTASGKVFDGNEEAQTRMARAIIAMNDTDETMWVLADNTPAVVTQSELKEALRLSGEEQTRIWVSPYQSGD